MCFRGCDASYLEGMDTRHADAFALEDVETACNEMDADTVLQKSWEKGSVFTIKAIESKNLNWNCGLYGACEGGHRELTEWMVEKGARDWNLGLRSACQGGHRGIAEWMIDKGQYIGIGDYMVRASDVIVTWPNGWLRRAQRIEKEATCWDEGLYSACRGGHRGIAEWMIEKGVMKSDFFRRQF